ncbi:DUF4595 domain-containing protein [Pedobacter nanyangensis]|uniref:DUF4595 domain-containing protein n=1 Tax=Pedobacter nanyangensis TaxID=1562389 RepID=UPI000DE1B8DD|nr:DUF4595 domain-containing protein [Pedobacter nanyangensis]
MKKSILTLSAAMLLIVASCSKNNENPTEETKTCRQTEARFNDGTVFQYTYDDKGRVVTWKQIWNGGSTETITYQYSANEIIETEKGDYNNVTKHTLDASGRITASGTTTYTYDANGYLLKIKDGSTTTDFVYTNGNITSINDGYSTYNITYGADTYSGSFFRYNTNDTFPEELETPLFSYYGKRSKALPTKSTVTRGGNETTETFTYEKDANGNITKFVNGIKQGANTQINTAQYTYSCN